MLTDGAKCADGATKDSLAEFNVSKNDFCFFFFDKRRDIYI